MPRFMYGAKGVDSIQQLIDDGEFLEALICIDNGILWNLKRLVYTRFMPAYKPRNELWDFIESREIDRFSFYYEICKKFKLIDGDRLKNNLKEFNTFRNKKLIHALGYGDAPFIMKSEVKKVCKSGIEILKELDKIWVELSLRQIREQPDVANIFRNR